jgi:arsenate reductase
MIVQPPQRITTVLFACVHNAGRSQIAACWFTALADPAKARAISAGTQPASRIHPEVVTAMREVGIEIGEVKPQLLTASLAREAQMLVTMGCNEECPVVPGLQRIDWNLADPKGETLHRVRAIRDELKELVSALISERGWSLGAFQVRGAREQDFPAVSRLLERAKLPLAGVSEHWDHFLVAESSGRLLGAVGLEIHGRSGLLRSLVVDENFRSKGVGRALVASLNPLIRGSGLDGLFLLTTTAADFFARLGFARIAREQLPASLNASEELSGACPASAVAMAVKLNG